MNITIGHYISTMYFVKAKRNMTFNCNNSRSWKRDQIVIRRTKITPKFAGCILLEGEIEYYPLWSPTIFNTISVGAIHCVVYMNSVDSTICWYSCFECIKVLTPDYNERRVHYITLCKMWNIHARDLPSEENILVASFAFFFGQVAFSGPFNNMV